MITAVPRYGKSFIYPLTINYIKRKYFIFSHRLYAKVHQYKLFRFDPCSRLKCWVYAINISYLFKLIKIRYLISYNVT